MWPAHRKNQEQPPVDETQDRADITDLEIGAAHQDHITIVVEEPDQNQSEPATDQSPSTGNIGTNFLASLSTVGSSVGFPFKYGFNTIKAAFTREPDQGPSEQQPLIQAEPTTQLSSTRRILVNLLAAGYTAGSVCMYGYNIIQAAESLINILPPGWILINTEESNLLCETLTIATLLAAYAPSVFLTFRDKLGVTFKTEIEKNPCSCFGHCKTNFTFWGTSTGFFKGLATWYSGAKLALRFNAPLSAAHATGVGLGTLYALAEGSLYSAEQRKRKREARSEETSESNERSTLKACLNCCNI